MASDRDEHEDPLTSFGGTVGLTRLAEIINKPTDYEQEIPEKCLDDAEFLYEAWMLILTRESRVLFAMGHEDEELETRWRKISLGVGIAFIGAFSRGEPLVYAQAGRGWFPFLVDKIRELRSMDFGHDAAVERHLLADYLQCVWDCHFMEVIGSPILGKTPTSWDQFVFWSIQSIAELAFADGKMEHFRLASAMTMFLTRRAREAVGRRDCADFEFRDKVMGQFVVVHELAALAERSKVVIERYGEKHVEKRFEEQLSVLLQSFGFIVVTADPGERRVDLVCFAPGNAGQAYSIIVEAKSTKGRYRLPTKDSRAIQEYVSDVRGRLTTLPPLRLVLVVGPDCTQTASGKIRDLEAATSVPVRYCHAGLLGWMRHCLPGPMPPEMFLRAALKGGPILSRSDLSSVVESDHATRSAHAAFVEALLAQSNHSGKAGLSKLIHRPPGGR